MCQTHTYAILQVSQATYEEIRAKLLAAGYMSQFRPAWGSTEEVIDMHGIALQSHPEDAQAQEGSRCMTEC